MSRRGAALFAAMCVIWGLPYLLIKIAVDELEPTTLVVARTGLGAAVLLPIAAARGELAALLRYWRPLLAFTAVEVTLPWLLLSAAEQHLTSSLTGLLVAAVPLVGALIGLLGGEETLGRRAVVGLLVGMAGVATLVGIDFGGAGVVPVLEMAGVVVGYAIGPFILTRHLAGAPGTGVIAVALALTALVYAPFGVAAAPSGRPSADVVVAVTVLALVCTALAFLVFFALIAEIGPVRAPVITYVNPAIAVLLGVLLLDEPFTARTATGFALVLAGSVLATGRRRTTTAATPITATPASASSR